MAQHVFDSVEEVLHQLADFFVEQAHAAVVARGRFSVALSGGSSPRKLYELLASPAYRERVPWAQVFFFFGDERNVPATDPQSNYLMAKTALLDPLQIPAAQIFPVDTSLLPQKAAQAYTQTINEFFGNEPVRFDLILLGLGDNSHTASLFPHTGVLHATTADVQAVYVEELQADRITLTAPLINEAHAVAFLVFGADKAAAVRRVLQGERNSEEYPAQLIAPVAGEAHWFLDRAAASELT